MADGYGLEIEDLLPALDNAAKRVDAKSWPADRHIVAFVAARFRFDVDKQIAALNSPQADTSALGLLSLLAVLQWKLGPEALPGLSGWIGSLVAPIINSYHNRDVRKRLEKEVPKLVRKGSLPDLYNTLDDVEERQKDLDGFAWAKAEFAGAEQEILDMEADSVITSYSIHYTKLYDHRADRAEHPRRARYPRGAGRLHPPADRGGARGPRRRP